jgi:quercetin dioxygenase-like cupin family protein
MIKINNYETLAEALRTILKDDEEYVLVRHDFSESDVVEKHIHPNVNEWIIFNSGKFEVALGLEKKVIEARGFSSVYFPKGEVHGIRCFTNISYFVVRDGKDDIVYTNEK